VLGTRNFLFFPVAMSLTQAPDRVGHG